MAPMTISSSSGEFTSTSRMRSQMVARFSGQILFSRLLTWRLSASGRETGVCALFIGLHALAEGLLIVSISSVEARWKMSFLAGASSSRSGSVHARRKVLFPGGLAGAFSWIGGEDASLSKDTLRLNDTPRSKPPDSATSESASVAASDSCRLSTERAFQGAEVFARVGSWEGSWEGSSAGCATGLACTGGAGSVLSSASAVLPSVDWRRSFFLLLTVKKSPSSSVFGLASGAASGVAGSLGSLAATVGVGWELLDDEADSLSDPEVRPKFELMSVVEATVEGVSAASFSVFFDGIENSIAANLAAMEITLFCGAPATLPMLFCTTSRLRALKAVGTGSMTRPRFRASFCCARETIARMFSKRSRAQCLKAGAEVCWAAAWAATICFCVGVSVGIGSGCGTSPLNLGSLMVSACGAFARIATHAPVAGSWTDMAGSLGPLDVAPPAMGCWYAGACHCDAVKRPTLPVSVYIAS
mmetsp:Transcript_4699/g.13722  ORF Transcript_4699/g.13722 Transcript_4699/m.13722 type:complete len:473 (+) Transcript_4699:837-2255(+)